MSTRTLKVAPSMLEDQISTLKDHTISTLVDPVSTTTLIEA